MQRYQSRPAEKKMPKDAKCLICGTNKKLIHAHIVPDEVVREAPALSKRRFRDYSGTNIFYLCHKDHKDYDDVLLPDEKFEILKPHIHRVIGELNSHIIELLAARVELPKAFFIRYQSFITTIHNYGKEE